MRTIPKKVILNLLDSVPTASEINALIYLYFIGDIDGKVRNDFYDIEEMKSQTCLSEISIKRAFSSLNKKGIIKRTSVCRDYKIINDYMFILNDHDNVTQGYIDVSLLMIEDLFKLSLPAKRLVLKLLVAENSKHSLRLTFNSLFTWSGVNAKSKGILLSILEEIKPFFSFDMRKKIVYFKINIHEQISSDFNELIKIDIQLKKLNIKASIYEKNDFLKNKRRFGWSIFDKALYMLSFNKNVRNLCAYLNYMADYLLSTGKYLLPL